MCNFYLGWGASGALCLGIWYYIIKRSIYSNRTVTLMYLHLTVLQLSLQYVIRVIVKLCHRLLSHDLYTLDYVGNNYIEVEY